MPPWPLASPWPWFIRKLGIWAVAGSCSSVWRTGGRISSTIAKRLRLRRRRICTWTLRATSRKMPTSSGIKAVGVHGFSRRAWFYAGEEYGKLTLGQVMAPAIKLARDDYPLAWEDARDLRDEDLSCPKSRHHCCSTQWNYYKSGEVFRQPELARTHGTDCDQPRQIFLSRGEWREN